MIDGIEMISESIPNQDKANEILERLIAVSSPSSVYSEPVVSGEYQVITASEVRIGMGFGFGGGGGLEAETESSEEDQSKEPSVGYGGGGGGGGAALGRPVAAIEIGPEGVRVKPIIDPTKIAIAFFTTLVSMFAMMGQMRRTIIK
jgi:uncharacterized spore protein YtfJ